jgi:2-polyprenyl-6-methoxyphenol hydroxylase-like FAD-dependent oxidoreductase
VVVVGAGPAGTALALLLARAGIAVELVESQRRHSALIRGDGLMPSGLAALNRMGLGSLLASLPRQELRGWSFLLEGRALFSVAEPIGGTVRCSLIDTPGLLEGMLEEALACPNLILRRGRAVKELLLEPEGTLPESRSPGRLAGVVLDDGTRLPAVLVVGCDGRGSTIRRLAGLELEEDNPPLEVLWFELENEAAAHLQPWIAGRFATLIGDAGSYALFGTARGGVRLGWLQERGAAGSPIPWPERWARSAPPELAALWRSLPAAALVSPLRLTVRSGLAWRWQRPGLLLLGDAAHPMSPLRAQGLNMALRDALVAAERLLPVLGAGGGAGEIPQHRELLQRLDQALVAITAARLPEIRAVQALQRQELGRGELLRRHPWLRRLLATTAVMSGPLLSRRWQAGQPTLRAGLPLSEGPA